MSSAHPPPTNPPPIRGAGGRAQILEVHATRATRKPFNTTTGGVAAQQYGWTTQVDATGATAVALFNGADTAATVSGGVCWGGSVR
jgi:hypothetical protein